MIIVLRLYNQVVISRAMSPKWSNPNLCIQNASQLVTTRDRRILPIIMIIYPNSRLWSTVRLYKQKRLISIKFLASSFRCCSLAIVVLFVAGNRSWKLLPCTVRHCRFWHAASTRGCGDVGVILRCHWRRFLQLQRCTAAVLLVALLVHWIDLQSFKVGGNSKLKKN